MQTATAIVIRQYNIIGTGLTVFDAWEPLNGHSTMTSLDDGKWYGRIGTRRLPAELAALPGGSDERIDAVTQWHREQYAEAYSAIMAEYPWTARGTFSMGDITINGRD